MQRAVPFLCASLYALGLGLVFALKRFYSTASAAELDWILRPTCWLARELGGIDLEPVAGLGFVSHGERIVVGPACAGVNFLVICAAMLFFSFAGRFRDPLRNGLWLLFCALSAYAATLATNAVRIVLAAELYALDARDAGLSPEMLHRLFGTLLYSLSLLGVYLCAESALRTATRSRKLPVGLIPCAWYLGVTIGIPLATRAYREDPARFFVHGVCVVGVALLVLALTTLPALLRNRLHSRSTAS